MERNNKLERKFELSCGGVWIKSRYKYNYLRLIHAYEQINRIIV